jgi:uncharacterized protein YnzC (UPF0291/DUF896 family)
MEKEKIARINALAHKAKTSGLTEAELAERDALRQEYLADIRASMIDQLEHTTVIEPDGTRRKLQAGAGLCGLHKIVPGYWNLQAGLL